MIIRIMGEGQWRLDQLDALQQADNQVEQAIADNDQARLAGALQALGDKVRELGQPLADDEFVDSDIIVPDPSATLEDVARLLDDTGSTEGLIPDRPDAPVS